MRWLPSWGTCLEGTHGLSVELDCGPVAAGPHSHPMWWRVMLFWKGGSQQPMHSRVTQGPVKVLPPPPSPILLIARGSSD